MDKNEIDVKIEKGKNISKIIGNIDRLQKILNTLTTSQIDITISNTSCGDLMVYGIFNKIVYKHFDEIKIDVAKTINDLKEELNQLIN